MKINDEPSIVISGIGGRYPESSNVEEFWNNLLSGRQLFTADDRRWPLGFLNLPPNTGKIVDIERFDSTFFNFPDRQANEMDPQFKICHEVTFEAILDAGLDPSLLATDRTGMYVGYCYSDTSKAQKEDASIYDYQWTETFSEVSKFFGFKGPCMRYDSACASSFSALNEAFHAIKAGIIDTAIVAGVAVCLGPGTACCFRELGMTSEDGSSRCLDKEAKGYVRSETICSIVIQRHDPRSAVPVKRIYGTILNSKSNSDGYKKEGITFPGIDSMIRLMRETYDDIPHIDPAKDVKYVEAHVTSTQVGDPVECNAIEAIFCPDGRTDPLLLGCLKSNMGHAEGASGAAAVTKACLILQRKVIPPNIGYQRPNPNIPGLVSGKLKPVLCPTPFTEAGSVISLNSFGFGGSNIHTIIQSFDGDLNINIHDLSGYQGINRLILFKGRTESSFETLKKKIINDPNDVTTEYLDFVNNVADLDDEKWNLPFRGYFILDKESKQIIKCDWRLSNDTTDAISTIVSVMYPLDHEATQLKGLIDITSVAGIKIVVSHESHGYTNKCLVTVGKSDGTCVQTSHNLESSNDVLTLIGDQYLKGVRGINLKNLYPAIKYPVSRTTASTSSLVSWNHEMRWTVFKVPEFFRYGMRSKRFHFDYNGHYRYLRGHRIDGRILFPASGYLWSVWQSLSIELVENTFTAYLKTKVKFWNVKLYQAIIVGDDLMKDEITFVTPVNSTTGSFEITRNGTLLVNGFVALDGQSSSAGDGPSGGAMDGDQVIGREDFYKELRVRGYDYEDDFQGVNQCNFNGTGGSVSFLKHWICFADAVFQLSLLNDPARSLHIPVAFELIKVDGAVFTDISIDDYRKYITISADDNNHGLDDGQGKVVQFEVKIWRETREIFVNGMYVKGLRGTRTSRKVACPVVRSYNQWHALDEVSVDDRDGHKREYDAKCVKLLMDIKNGNVISPSDPGHKMKASADHVLLQHLVTFSSRQQQEQGKQQSVDQEILDQLVEDHNLMSKDVLISVPIRNDVMIHIISIILDVIGSRMISITEINLSNSDSVESNIKSLISSQYKMYRRNGDGQDNVDTFLASQSKLDADLVFIQHPSLSFKFLHSKQESMEIEVKFYDVMNHVLNHSKDGSFVVIAIRRGSYGIERELRNDMYDFDDVSRVTTRMQEMGYTLICTKEIGSFNFVLFRNFCSKKSSEIVPQTFEMRNVLNFEWIDDLKGKMQLQGNDGNNHDDTIWIIINEVANDSVHGMNGFVNCLKHEDDRIHLIIFSDDTNEFESLEKMKEKCFKMKLRSTIIKNGTFGTNGYSMNYNDKDVESKDLLITATGNTLDITAMCLNIRTKGDLSSLYYERIPIETREDGSNIIDVHYAPLNFKDVMIASGRVPSSAYPDTYRPANSGEMGMEFSGVDCKGRRVMGLIPTDAIATKISVSPLASDFLFDVPTDMTLEEAATIPVVYVTVYYALVMRGKLVDGESVLIHAGSGGVGQAAINVCQSMGCEIFTTVGTLEKRQFIKTQFNISDDHIFDSRSISFSDDLLRATNGRGVDLVLNSLSEDKLQAGLNCLAVNGRFVEIGKYDFVADTLFDLTKLTNNQTFQATCLAYFLTKCKEFREGANGEHPEVRILKDLMDHGLKSGAIKPLSRTMFNWNQAEEAFRFMATGKHVGKVIINMKDAEEQMSKKSDGADNDLISSSANERVSLDAEKSYLIIGGLGGMGLELCQWLVTKGARTLIVTSRSGIQNSYQKFFIERIESCFGCKIFVRTENVSNHEEAQNLIDFCNNLAPVGGIFNLAMVLKDNLFVNQTIESFEECCSVKVNGSGNLDKMSRASCPKLDYFVCFSSVASSFGNPGQSNYGFANSFMDNLCSKRRSEGLPALAIAWGAVGDIGHVAEKMGHDAVIGGTVPQRINSCLEVLERSLNWPLSNVSSFVLFESSIYEVEGDLLASVFNVLGIKDHSKVDPGSTLGSLGIDSLMAVEIKQIIQNKYEKILTTKEIRELTVQQIKSMASVADASDINVKGAQADINLFTTGLNLPLSVFEVLGNDDSEGDPIFIFPPLDGTFLDLKPLIEQLSCGSTCPRPIIGINWTKEAFGHETIPLLATFYIEHLQQVYPNLVDYDFVAYSIGSSVALEMALQLEQCPRAGRRVGHLILLDGSPTFVKEYSIRVLKTRDVSNQKSWTSIFLEYSNSIGGIDLSKKFTKIPDDAKNIRKWLSMATTLDKGKSVTEQGVVEAMDRIRQKTFMAVEYDPVIKLDMDVHLIRSTEETFESMGDDYDLNRFVSGNVSVIKYVGNHKSFLLDNAQNIANDVQSLMSMTMK